MAAFSRSSVARSSSLPIRCSAGDLALIQSNLGGGNARCRIGELVWHQGLHASRAGGGALVQIAGALHEFPTGDRVELIGFHKLISTLEEISPRRRSGRDKYGRFPLRT
jgi:hypothetical protein